VNSSIAEEEEDVDDECPVFIDREGNMLEVRVHTMMSPMASQQTGKQ
jgi:hypothetical protein